MYASLDYYCNGIPTSPFKRVNFAPGQVSSDGQWLVDYIYDRLIDSFKAKALAEAAAHTVLQRKGAIQPHEQADLLNTLNAHQSRVADIMILISWYSAGRYRSRRFVETENFPAVGSPLHEDIRSNGSVNESEPGGI